MFLPIMIAVATAATVQSVPATQPVALTAEQRVIIGEALELAAQECGAQRNKVACAIGYERFDIDTALSAANAADAAGQSQKK